MVGYSSIYWFGCFALQSLATVGTRCICELMTSLTHFNFRNNIFTVVVSLLSTPGVEDEVS